MLIKICGLQEREHVLQAVNSGSDLLGFVFAESSRKVTPEQVVAITGKVPGRAKKVGVFVDESLSVVNEIARYCSLDLVQLHGNESPDYCRDVVCPVIKAFRVQDRACLEEMKNYHGIVEMYLMDTYVQGISGGTGITFDWSLAREAAEPGKVVLAGGLNPDNVTEAINTARPFGVDVSGGVETGGIKDPAKIDLFIKRVRGVVMYTQPDKTGHFGEFGGKFVPETLMPALDELENAYKEACSDPEFLKELNYYLREYVGRPSNLYYARGLTEHCGGAKIYLKREDLNHTGAHKINNTIGQVLLAKRMGKKRVIAETGAGQHGVATATAAALFGLECTVFMGQEDIRRQELNVFRMKLLGAQVEPVLSGSCTLKDAMNEAIREWVTNVRTTFYVLGSVGGPHPYPMMVRDFQKIIGEETREQILRLEGRLPDCIIACVGGGSNAIGIFYPFIEETEVKMIGVEAAGHGTDTPRHAATLTMGSKGVLHGAYSYILQDEAGQILEAHSVSAGLDYPGVGPEHSYLKETGRVQYKSITDAEALEGFQVLCRTEGIIPALESSHAVAQALKTVPSMDNSKIVVINLSGRGDKDVQTIAQLLEVK